MYYIYQLRFTAPVHFGAAEQGGHLEKCAMTITADTLFSAICCELAGSAALDSFIADCASGAIALSDLFPYADADGDTEFFIPRPVLRLERTVQANADREAQREAVLARKKLKKLNYIRASRLGEYIAGLTSGTPFSTDGDVDDFGAYGLTTRVNVREGLPYHVGSFSFREGAGLYGIVYLADDARLAEFTRVLEYLGMSGIGGKRSSGYGRFELYDDPYALEDSFSDDDAALAALLTAPGDYYLALASVVPAANDIPTLADSYYQLRRRSGFAGGSGEIKKKNSIYMLAAGSCLRERIAGAVVSLGDYAGHSVYRYGRGMYLGVKTS